MSTLKVNAIRSTSDVEMFLAKAWVNFNGSGTVAIRASGNVSSITDLGGAVYQINFATALPSANFAMVGSAGNNANAAGFSLGIDRRFYSTPVGTTFCIVRCVRDDGNTGYDSDDVCAAFFI